MAKNGRKTLLLFSAALIFIYSCSTPPTYTRKDIENIMRKICVEEFNLDIKVWEAGDTIWLYAPLQKIVDSTGQLDKTVSDKMRQVFLSLKRIVLSMDKPPKFYAFVFSDIKLGADLYYIGFIPDMIKVEMSLISLGEWQEREVFNFNPNRYAIDDTEGKHISPRDITMPDFISYLVKQTLERKLTSKEYAEDYEITDLYTYYYNKKFIVIFDLKNKKPSPKPIDLFKESRTMLKKFLGIFDAADIESVEVHDIGNGKQDVYSRKMILEEK